MLREDRTPRSWGGVGRLWFKAVTLMYDKVIKAIRDVGFPIAIAVILLIDRITVLDTFIKTMTRAIHTLEKVERKLEDSDHRK